MQETLSFVFVAILEIYFLALLYTILKVSIIGVRSRKWSTTEGEIIVSEANEENRLFTGVVAKKQRISIGYRYTVNGRTFERTTVSAGEYVNASKLWREKMQSRCCPSIPVYYDSDTPGRALLEPGVDINLILSVLLVLLGVLFFPVMLLLTN